MTTVIHSRPVANRSRLLVVSAAGAAIVCSVLFLVGLPPSDTVKLVGMAGGGAAFVAAATAVAGRRSLGSVRGLLVLTALVPVVATVLGAATASWLMFLSDHDLRALLVMLVVSGSVGLATALYLSDRVIEGTAAVVDLARAVDAGPVRLESRRRLPDELRAVADELEEASGRLVEASAREAAMDASRRELVAWVSHDLRTPLAGIRAMSEALEDGVVEDVDTVARYHRTIRQEADRLAGLVDDLFELSRIHAGALALAPELVPLADVVGDAVAGASVAATAKGVVLEGRADEPSPLVELSTPEMARVVRNLLDNAIRHTPTGGRVRVTAGSDGDQAVVVVADACGGLADHDLDRVFDLAYRGDEARTPGDGRAGLGLAIAKGLVEAHHGSIAVANAGRGCRFTVSLPLAGAVAG
jgi:signal transduction histidine kinase